MANWYSNRKKELGLWDIGKQEEELDKYSEKLQEWISFVTENACFPPRVRLLTFTTLQSVSQKPSSLETFLSRIESFIVGILFCLSFNLC